jgi:hypothetical protein
MTAGKGVEKSSEIYYKLFFIKDLTRSLEKK